MEIDVIKIGNSKGIRLSKTVLSQYGIGDKLTLELKKDMIVLKPLLKPRKGWERAYKRMSDNGDDSLLLPDVFEDEEFEDWN